MADTAYTYAVARIRVKENSLLNNADIEQLIACKNYESCIAFLREKGWGGNDLSDEDILSNEVAKNWEEMRGLVPDDHIFDVLKCKDEYHNLKAAIKQVYSGDKAENIYYTGTKTSPEELREMVEKRDFSKLTKEMADAAMEATEALLHTGDGQLCDIIIDKATLEAIQRAGERSGSEFIQEYAEEVIAVADIRIAIRCVKTGKTKGFMERAMAVSAKLDINRLMECADSGMEAVCDYLAGVGYMEAVESIQESYSAFERWCDNRIINTIKSQKYNPFSVGPVVAYILAKENEVKTVRIILTGKANHLADDFIRERVRDMYV